MNISGMPNQIAMAQAKISLLAECTSGEQKQSIMGNSQGIDQGWNQGADQGWNQGADQGWNQGADQGWNAGGGMQSSAPDKQFSVGKHRGQFFSQVAMNDPAHCELILRKIDEGQFGGVSSLEAEIQSFAAYLRGTGEW